VIIYLASFVVFLVIGVPVAISLGLASLTYMVVTGKLVLLLAFPRK
jgi:C4-dicarboxylate transporter DctM subunit